MGQPNGYIAIYYTPRLRSVHDGRSRLSTSDFPATCHDKLLSIQGCEFDFIHTRPDG